MYNYHITMEVIELSTNDITDVSAAPEEKPGVSFGPGIELLMNDKKRTGSSDNLKLDLGDLDDLEKEMNNLSGVETEAAPSAPAPGGAGIADMASNLFGLGKSASASAPAVEEVPLSDLGQATRESVGNTQTWDGFSKMSEIPSSAPSRPSNNMNDREKRRKKRMMIKKLDEWHEKGLVKNNSHFTLDSDFDEVEDEYETALEDKRKKDGIKLQGWWFMTAINSLEYANAVFNPFDLNLDGWGEQVNEDIDSYDEIFSELHDKYKGGKMAPELSLLLRVGFSAAVLNFSNKALSSAAPAFNDVIKQSPELMKMFTNATASSLSQQSPGFEFAQNLMQENNSRPRGPPPPAPMETKNQPPPPRPMPETSNRPDLDAGRGTMFMEKGVDMNNGFQNISAPQMPSRPEMKGPSTDIDNILSGLKTRSINIQDEPAAPQDNDSKISISSLKDMENTKMPKRTNRKRNTSEKNVISLDI